MRERFLERRDLIVRLLNAIPGVTCRTPGGAFYAWPNVTEACRKTGCADSEELRKRLLHEAGVAVLADIHFGRRVPGDGQHIRFSYAASNDAIERGIDRFADFVHRTTVTMTNPLDDNAAAREAILARVRAALAHQGKQPQPAAVRDARIARRTHGPRPAMPDDLVSRFLERATDMASTVERLPSRAAIPASVARYLDALELPAAIAAQKSHRGVCWPEFADLDWRGAGLEIEARPTAGDDRLGITGCLCAIAETGTIVVTSSAATPTATTLLPTRTSWWCARATWWRGWKRHSSASGPGMTACRARST